jgi:hypothetical protein
MAPEYYSFSPANIKIILRVKCDLNGRLKGAISIDSRDREYWAFQEHQIFMYTEVFSNTGLTDVSLKKNF